MSLYDSSNGCFFPFWVDQVGLLPCGHCSKCLENKGKKFFPSKEVLNGFQK